MITIGNLEDDIHKISNADWVIEAVVEDLKIKHHTFKQVEKYRKQGTLISSNTSGIPIGLMLQSRSEDFQKHFCGTHFFNPPRYLKLLEIIPTPKTDPKVVDFYMHYGDLFLGKKTVLCKDTPAFIANRIGIYSIMKILQTMQKIGLNIDQVDKLTGQVIGRPKSATFRTLDLVGLDTLVKVADNLNQSLENDEARSIFSIPSFIYKMEENNMLGDKTGQGFYKKLKKNGKSIILTLDLTDFEYKEKQKISFPTLELTKVIPQTVDRYKTLLHGQDKAGEFYRHTFYSLFQYVSNRIPDISDELYRIDDALRAGFGWEMGPFQSWDAAHVRESVKKMEEMSYKPNQWVYDMLQAGVTSFYKKERGKEFYYDISSKAYKEIPGTEGLIILSSFDKESIVWSNSGCDLIDIGDGILNLNFHTKANALGSEVIEGINESISIAEKKNWKGLVIANEGQNFSAGANLALLFMYAVEQEWDEVEMMIRQFQDTMMRIRYSAIPVVVAPHSMALGGGCELVMHSDLVQAAAETYMGLVEVGVGLLPAGGGTKEMTLRVSDAYEKGDTELNALQNALMTIATAKVATSANHAKKLGLLRSVDRISINSDRRVVDAKHTALYLSERGYTQPVMRDNIKVQGKTGLASFYAGIYGMKMGNYISEHDLKIAQKIAWVMCGGDLSVPTEVDEQYLLDLEREAFVSLVGEKKTMERIHSIINGKGLIRN